jgi:hypothetical protein
MKFGNEFWLILFWEHISPKLFAVCGFRNFLLAYTVDMKFYLTTYIKADA